MTRRSTRSEAQPSLDSTRRGFIKGAAALGAGGAAASTALLGAINQGAAAEGEPIPVGGAVPLTGWAAADAIEFQRGLEMACEDINAMGGILGRPLEPHFEDTRDGGADVVSQSMQRLIDRHDVHAIIHGYNPATLEAEYDVVADNGIIYTHTNTSLIHHDRIKKEPERFFGCFQSDPSEYWYGEGFLAFLNDLVDKGLWTPANKKIAIVVGAQNYSIVIGNSVRDNAAKYGWETSLYETVQIPISEWGPTLAKIRRDPPGVICITHYLPQDLAQFQIQFTPNPTPSLVYMQYGPSLRAFRDIGKEATNGVVYGTVIATLPDEIGDHFSERYRAKFGDDASPLVGSQPYDAAHMWAIAAALSGGPGAPGEDDQNRKVAAMMNWLTYRGACGTLRFEENGAVTYPGQTNDPSLGMPHQFLQIQDHKEVPKLIAPWPYQKAEFKTPDWI